MSTPQQRPRELTDAEFEERLRKRFARMDVDKDGKVTKAELKAAIKEIRLPFNKGDSGRILKSMDKDDNGTIDYAVRIFGSHSEGITFKLFFNSTYFVIPGIQRVRDPSPTRVAPRFQPSRQGQVGLHHPG